MKYINKVYLSGGLGNDWHGPIIDRFKEKFIFFNPRTHGLDHHSEYTPWDLHYVQQCDILFAYIEETNQSGYGLTLELGYARASNKTIILVDERSAVDPDFEKRFLIVRQSSSRVFDDLPSGLNFLEAFTR